MVLLLAISRQRLPMLSAAALEDRTRPAMDGSVGARLRYFSWSHLGPGPAHLPRHEQMPTAARLGRRQGVAPS